MAKSTSEEPPEPTAIEQTIDGKFLHFRRLMLWLARWFYRIVIVFFILGLLASLVQGLVLTLLTGGNFSEQFHLLQFVWQHLLVFCIVFAILIGLGIPGHLIDRHFTKTEKAHEQSAAAHHVLEQKGPELIKKGIDEIDRIQAAVKKGIEESGLFRHTVEEGIEKVFKDQEKNTEVLSDETTSWKPPRDIAVLPLPPPASGLVGREKEQEWLISCILSSKIVGISGIGGVGKTALIADTINKVWPQFRNGGIAVIPANAITDPTNILSQLIKKFVPNEQGLLNGLNTKPDILRDALCDTLTMHHEKGNRIIIVIDSIEPSIINSDELERLSDIFRSAKVSVVITAREPLSARIVQESRELDVFTNKEAVNLLTRLLPSSLHHIENQYLVEICENVGNHALAIVLMAAYFEYHPQESLATYLQRLKDSPSIVLALSNRLRPDESSQGIQRTFNSSYSRLDEPTQQLFVALGSLAGQGCTFQAVQALGKALNQSEDETLSSLESLIRSKLVLKSSKDGERTIVYIHLHPLVQEFSRKLLKDSDDLESTLSEALAAHYAEWVQENSANISSDDEVNIIAALRWANAHLPQADIILAKLAYSLRWYWRSQLQIEEAFEWLKVGCDSMERLGSSWQARRGELMFALGAQYQWIGKITEAERCYKRSYTIFHGIKSRAGSKVAKVGMGEALSGIAALAQQKGEMEKAKDLYEKSLEFFRIADEPRCEADALYRLGFLALRVGNIDDALRFYRESLDIRLGLEDDQWGESVILYSLGNVFQQIGEIDKAQLHYEEALTLCKKIYNRRLEGIVLKALGDLALQTNGPREAERYLNQSHEISNEIYDPQSESIELYSMGFLLRQIGKVDDALTYYKRSLEIREKIKDERGRGFTLKGLGDLERRLGDMAKSKNRLEESVAICTKIKDRRNEGVALKALGDWEWQEGHMNTARDYYNASLMIRKECRDLRGEAITLKALGDQALKDADITVARQYLNQSLDLFHYLKDKRGEGITLHSLGILALEKGDRVNAQKELEQSLSFLQKVQDRQSEAIVLYTIALLVEYKGDFSQAEEYYRTSLKIAIELKATVGISIVQQTLSDLLIRRYSQTAKENDLLLIEAARITKQLGQLDNTFQPVEKKQASRNKGPDRSRMVCALINDMDDGPNGQSFAVPTERRSSGSTL
jgi:tetratricopeptide (TPR) repeat protein